MILKQFCSVSVQSFLFIFSGHFLYSFGRIVGHCLTISELCHWLAGMRFCEHRYRLFLCPSTHRQCHVLLMAHPVEHLPTTTGLLLLHPILDTGQAIWANLQANGRGFRTRRRSARHWPLDQSVGRAALAHFASHLPIGEIFPEHHDGAHLVHLRRYNQLLRLYIAGHRPIQFQDVHLL